MDDFVLNVRQIGQYPEVTSTGANDLLLLQVGGTGGAYASIPAPDLVASAMLNGRIFQMPINGLIGWGGAQLSSDGLTITSNAAFSAPSLTANQILLGTQPVATAQSVTDTANAIIDSTVWSFNGRNGDVVLVTDDVLRAGGAPITNAHFNGWITAPSAWDPRLDDDTVATTHWVQTALCAWYSDAVAVGKIVASFNGRGGDVVLNNDDITAALTVPGQFGLANTAPSGDASKRIANTLFVDDAITNMQLILENEFTEIASNLDQTYAPINSPQFTGVPTAPTAAQTVNSGQLATTAFVHAAVTASTTGVASFNTRTGAVVLTAGDVTGAGGAPLASPVFTGTPAAPTPAPGDNTTKIATTAFVEAAIAGVSAGVTSFNTRTGAVSLTSADVTGVGGALLASPTFTGTPAGPTAAPSTSTTQLATTAFVGQAISALAAPVTSFNGRTGAITFQGSDISAVNGALLASPAFTGVPTAPTATVGTSNTQIATTAFVQAALSGVVSGVSTFNGRSGAVTLIAADVTAAGGALLAGPTFTGVPAAPTATSGTNTTQLATTAFVQAALSAAPGGVTSFNSRTGAIVFQASDISAVGGALLSNPSFTGNPTAPTPAPGDNDTSIATTAFVTNALAASGGVNSFNGRAGVVTLTSQDVYNAEGAIFQQADTAPSAGVQTFWYDSLHGQLYVRYIDPVSSAQNWVIANPPPPPVPMSFYNYLGGLTLSNDGVSPNTVIDVAAGSAAADDNSMMMVLSSSFTKALGGPWAAGSGSAGLDTGTFAATTWYHVFLIMRPDTGVVDVLLSTSASAPLLPGNYTKKRRIGSIKTDASARILAFTQVGDQFGWASTGYDVNNANVGTAATLFPVSVPTGIQVTAIVNILISNATSGAILYIGSPGVSMTNGNIGTSYAGGNYVGAQFLIRTDTSGNFSAKANNALTAGFYASAAGWLDNRGK